MRPSNPLLNRLAHPAWALGSGILLGLSMPPYGLYPLAWFALIPLFVRWSLLQHAMTVFREAYAVFLLMSVIAGFWVLLHTSVTAALYSGVGLLLVPLPYAIAITLAAFVRQRFGLAIGILSLFANVLAAEFLISHGPYALPWMLIGHTQADALLFNQIADLGGVGILTFGVLLMNVLGMLFVRASRREGFIPGWRTMIALLMLIAGSSAAVYGDERLSSLASTEESVQVAIIQPAIDARNWSDATNGDRVEHLADLSDRMLEDRYHLASFDGGEPTGRPDLVIWPEGTIPVFEENDRQFRLYQRLTTWSRMRNVALLSGAVTSDPSHSTFFNSAMMFRAGQRPQKYEKLHLVPFTEGLPAATPNPILAAMSLPTTSTRLASGQNRVVLDGEDYRVGTSIGMESLHGDHNRLHVADGADFLVSLAQNGWWGRSPGTSQHIRLTRLRAIETRRPVVVATVSGTSGVVYPDGQIDTVAGWMKEETARRSIPIMDTESMYVRYGDWPGRYATYPAAALFLLFGFSAAAKARPKGNTKKKRKPRKRR